MFKFCETEKFKAGMGAAFLLLLLVAGSWGIGIQWKQYGRIYERYEGVVIAGETESTVSLKLKTTDNLRTLVLLWVFIGVPCSFLIDHIQFVQWVLYCWEPLPPNEIE